MRNPYPVALLLLLLLSPSAGAQSTNNDDAVYQDAVSQTVSADPVSDAIRGLLNDAQWKPGLVKLDWQRLKDFYQRRNYQAAWTSDDGVSRARDALSNADREGLEPDDYAIDAIKPPQDNDPGRWARYDVLLTNSALRYAQDLRLGRQVPASVYPDVDYGKPNFNAAAELQNALANGSFPAFLNALPPQQRGYAALRDLLAKYEAMAQQGGWQSLPDTRTIALRKRDPLFAKLKARVHAEDAVLAQTGSPPQTVHDAVAIFQREHGLSPTGIADKKTIDELNVGVDARIAEIKANLERWRWLPRASDPRYVVVNVPAETLDVFDSGQSILHSRVVVGRGTNPTPLLYAVATSLTVNPVWHIPADIMKKEILPKDRAHPGYMKRQHIEAVDGAHLRFKQLPGPKNALGALRIDMPNQFNIYLHDTPGRSLFARNERDESHGCIRVEQILPLASIALTGNPDQAQSDLKDAIDTRTTRQYEFDNSLPVYVVYRTVTVDDDDRVQFWPDIYDRDVPLEAALKNRNASLRVSVL